jgi:hypothetical protein
LDGSSSPLAASHPHDQEILLGNQQQASACYLHHQVHFQKMEQKKISTAQNHQLLSETTILQRHSLTENATEMEVVGHHA